MSAMNPITSRLDRAKRRIPRKLREARPGQPVTWSARRLNRLTSKMPAASTYLEVGVQHGTTLEQVQVPFKWGVDPYPRFQSHRLPEGYRFFRGTSDHFFGSLPSNVRFDLVFLDGLHTWSQTYRDLIHVSRHCHDLSVVLIDDVLPSDEFSALPSEEEALRRRHATGRMTWEWHGDVYKTLVAIDRLHPELDFHVIQDFQGNSQAVVWWRSGKSAIRPGLDAQLLEIDEIQYSDVFKENVVPSFFRAGDEDYVLQHVTSLLLDRASLRSS